MSGLFGDIIDSEIKLDNGVANLNLDIYDFKGEPLFTEVEDSNYKNTNVTSSLFGQHPLKRETEAVTDSRKGEQDTTEVSLQGSDFELTSDISAQQKASKEETSLFVLTKDQKIDKRYKFDKERDLPTQRAIFRSFKNFWKKQYEAHQETSDEYQYLAGLPKNDQNELKRFIEVCAKLISVDHLRQLKKAKKVVQEPLIQDPCYRFKKASKTAFFNNIYLCSLFVLQINIEGRVKKDLKNAD